MLVTVKMLGLVLGFLLLFNSAFLMILRREVPTSGWYLYESNVSGNRDIYRTRLDDSSGQAITHDPNFDVTPSPSRPWLALAWRPWLLLLLGGLVGVSTQSMSRSASKT